MTELLFGMDVRLLYFINHTLSNPFFDWLMPLARNKWTWLPVYALIVFAILKKYGLKSVWVIVFALLAVVISDQLSSGVLKPLFERPRPCSDPRWASWLLLPNGKGSGWSFVSSHSANHFAMSIYFIMVFGTYRRRYRVVLPFLLWAFLVAFAQVYIGFHYPSDVLAGGVLGCLIGYGAGRLNCLVLCYRSGQKI